MPSCWQNPDERIAEAFPETDSQLEIIAEHLDDQNAQIFDQNTCRYLNDLLWK